nr:aldehyde reductase [uncultured Cohaesibacter sp.]
MNRLEKRIMVTGASGYLGGHVVLEALNEGYLVRGSIRSLAKEQKLRNALEQAGADISRLELVELDLTKDDNWYEAMQDVDYLLHTASPFMTHIPKDPEKELFRPAIDGTRRALTAALEAKVEHVVLTSSVGSVSYGHPKSHGPTYSDEDWTNVSSDMATPYQKSKTLAEKKAWEIMQHAERHNDLSVVNPGFIVGPMLDDDPGTSGAVVLKMMKGGFPAAPDMHFNFVDVGDLAKIHIAAMTAPEARGKRIIAAGDTVSMLEFARLMAKTFPKYGKALPTRPLPSWLFNLVSMFDGETRASRGRLGEKFNFETSLARKLLGREFTSLPDMAQTMGQALIDKALV